MHHSRIQQKESLFLAERKNLGLPYQLRPLLLGSEKETNCHLGYQCRRSDGLNGYFYTEETPKERIVLHYTAGHFAGDLRTLTRKDYHVSVAYLISREGTIFELFPPENWSYHLGRSAIGGNTTESKKTIGIELSNYGYLIPRGEQLHTIYHESGDTPFCSIHDEDLFTRLETPFRGRSYYAAFTHRQYESLIVLLRFLCKKFDIPPALLPETIRHETTEEVLGFRGICSHVNYRQDKWDLGPAFDWERVIAGLAADDFTRGTYSIGSLREQLAGWEQALESEPEREGLKAIVERNRTLLKDLEFELSGELPQPFSKDFSPFQEHSLKNYFYGEDGPEVEPDPGDYLISF